ncbi:MAG: SURF1 family protein [Pseudomonadota bacterium]
MSLLTALLFPTLLWLGFWQLDRAQEKTFIAAQNAAQAEAAPISLGEAKTLTDDELAFRRIELVGVFDPDVVILSDNQIRDGRYGHDVYGLFRDVSGGVSLLNRGWIAGDPSRRSLPAVETPVDEFVLVATVYVPPGEPYLLAEESFNDLTFPRLVQSVQSDKLYAALAMVAQQPLFAYELRLEPSAGAGFRRDWPVINVSPEKHQGYALQWFTMAAALLLFFIIRSSNVMDLVRRSPTSSSDTQDREI